MRFLLLLCCLAVLDGAYADHEKSVKVVYHIATADNFRHYFALQNLENQLQDLRQRNRAADIKVLLEGEGIFLLLKAVEDRPLQRRITSLRGQGVHFLLERESLPQLGLKAPYPLFGVSEEDWVDNGILALVEWQRQGYAYIPYVAE